MSTWTFTSGSSTFSVMGCTALTIGAGANSATDAQYSATYATMLANIVAAINLATANAVNIPAGWVTTQIRNEVFARANGNNLELMTRSGSASWNSLVALAFANVTGSSSQSWSGGSGGCWGYLFNHRATMWPSAQAAGTYGVWAANKTLAGSSDAGDVVKVRSNKTVTLTTNVAFTWVMAAMGTAQAPVRFDVDDGTEWPADGSTPVLKITDTRTNNTAKTWSHLATTFAHIKATQYAGGQRSLVLESVGNGSVVPNTVVMYGGPVRFDNVDLYCPGTPTASPGPIASCSAQFSALALSTSGVFSVFNNCRIVQPGQVLGSTIYSLIYNGANGYTRGEFVNGEFVLTAPSAAWNYTISPIAGGSPCRILLDSCVFTGFVSGSRLIASGGTIAAQAQGVVARNCSWGGITVLGPNYLGSSSLELDAGIVGLFVSSQHGDREFAIDRAGRLYVEWVAAKARPTLNAKLHDGTTPWSIFATATPTQANISKIAPVDLPRIGKAVPTNALLTEGVRTFTLNFLLESLLSWTKQDISILVDYVGTDDVPRTIDTYDGDGGALTTSVATWSSTSWNGQTWLPKSFDVTTPVAVKAGTEVGIYIRIHSVCSADTRGVIIDPEVIIT
jgi:hypothetical protein